jgi:hypothetical protein
MVHLAVHCAEVLDAPDMGLYMEAMRAFCECQGLEVHTAILIVTAFKAGITMGELMGSEVLLSWN